MREGPEDHTLEFLLAFDGRIHIFEKGYWIKFEITKGDVTEVRPHALSYSFTLHAPDGTRLIGFGNAHAVPAVGGRYKKRHETYDHWRRTESDQGRPYDFKSAEGLIDDFFDEVERVLGERGIGNEVVEVKETRRPK